MDIKKLVGLNIRHQRKKLGYSQETLAYTCGLSSDYVAKCERGMMNMTLENLARIAKGLKIPISDLFELSLHR